MKKAVLAVDDSRTVLNMIELYLKEEYDVFLATSGDQAFQILQKKTIDMILLDIVMPVMNGLIVLKKIREIEECKDIPVLFLTGDAHRATVVESFQTGSQGYILKPVTKENLIQRIEEGIKKQKERLIVKAEEEKRLEEERVEAERKRLEAEKAEEEKKRLEIEKKRETPPEHVEDTKKVEEEILVRPIEEDMDLSHDPFDDMGDVLENFVKKDDSIE